MHSILVLARMPKFRHLAYILIFVVGSQPSIFAVDIKNIAWGTEHATDSFLGGPDYYTTDSNFASAKALAFLKSLNTSGDTASDLAAGDWIELGFFDLDLTDDSTSSSINPNSSTTDLFQGVWTPLSSITVIGQDYDTAGDVGAGEFYFTSKIEYDTGTSTNERSVLHNVFADITIGSSDSRDILDGTTDPSSFSADNLVEDRVSALYTESYTNSNPVPLGIRFYDTNSKTSGTTKYNTIMNPNWTLDFDNSDWVELDLLELNGGSMQVNSGLVFEFDNTDANTADVARVGNANSGGGTQVINNDFVTTITYHDGSTAFSANTASHILSGLQDDPDAGSIGAITVGGNTALTLHANSGQVPSFSGDITGGGTASSTIIKTGTGKQILSGDLLTTSTGSSSGWVNVSNGTLSLAGSGSTYSVEYLTGSGGALELNTTDVIELGFANTTSSQSFDGNVSLVGTGDRTIKIASGTDPEDYKLEQNISGVISGSNKLVKTGVGRLVLEADNENSGGVDIDDGTLVIGNSANDADAGSGSITINKGKLEVLSGDTVSNTIAGGSGKSMVGGAGTVTTLTIGNDSGEVDYISPGRGISSSLSPSEKQVNLDYNESGSIDQLTITTLNWNSGGVFDWQIKDFDASGGTAGTDWDLLNFGTLNFESGQTFDLNLMAISSTDGSQGAPDNLVNTWSGNYQETNGFLFMSGTTVSGIGTGDVTSSFNIRTDDFYHSANNWYGNWGVWRNGGDFYLTYSAVPEPSTYMMVTGLLMVPGMSYYRRLRKKKDPDGIEENQEL